MVSRDINMGSSTGARRRGLRDSVSLWLSKLSFGAFVLVTAFAIFAGWRLSRFDLLTPEKGLGYALGIVGGSLMLLLLVYPLRKRIKRLTAIGTVRTWFRLHMILGIIGPVLILFHANFGLGSLNSNVAFFSMLIVSASGLIGRYTYAKFHRGLYGETRSLTQLVQDLGTDRNALNTVARLAPSLEKASRDIPQWVTERPRSLAGAITRHLRLKESARRVMRTARREIRVNLIVAIAEGHLSKSARRPAQRSALALVQHYVKSCRKLADFILYERIFALWHLAHIPLFCMLIVAALVHVVAVHAY